MESRRNGPQLSSRHDDDDDGIPNGGSGHSKATRTETCTDTRDGEQIRVGFVPQEL